MWINLSTIPEKLTFLTIQTNDTLRLCTLHRVYIDNNRLTLSFRIRMKYKKTISRCSLKFNVSCPCNNICYQYQEPYKWNGTDFCSVIHNYDFSSHRFSEQDESSGIKYRKYIEPILSSLHIEDLQNILFSLSGI